MCIRDSSYIINGWNDVLERQMTSSGETFNMGSIMNKTINESVIVEPSETLVYGEKLYPIGHFFMDLMEGNLGNDNEVLNHAMHNSAVRSDRGGSPNGGSNFAFADVSTRNAAGPIPACGHRLGGHNGGGLRAGQNGDGGG